VKHERAKEEGSGQPAGVSESGLSRVPRCAQWEPPSEATLSLPELQDLLWGHARDTDVWAENACGGGGASAVDRDATRQLAGSRRDHWA
jgi:hypothetical protein